MTTTTPALNHPENMARHHAKQALKNGIATAINGSLGVIIAVGTYFSLTTGDIVGTIVGLLFTIILLGLTLQFATETYIYSTARD